MNPTIPQGNMHATSNSSSIAYLPTSDVQESSQSHLENSMKDLLEKILTYMEKFIQTKEDLAEIEQKLNDYDNLNSLMDIIKTIFVHLTFKIDDQLAKKSSSTTAPTTTTGTTTTITKHNSSISAVAQTPEPNNEEYEQLEKILQKHEAEIRVHIRSNQTMKLYQENLQQKLEESEAQRSELLNSTKQIIHDIKRQNNSLSEKIALIEIENRELKDKIKDLTEKSQAIPYLQDRVQTLEKQLKDNEAQEKFFNSSISNLQRDNSLKKEIDTASMMIRKQNNKGETILAPSQLPTSNPLMSSMMNTSPIKVDRRTPTPNSHLQTSSGKENATNSLKSSYQRFYNNVKIAKEENRELRSSNGFQNSNLMNVTNLTSATKNLNMQQPTTVMRERENSKNIHISGGNSLTNSHNNSFAYPTTGMPNHTIISNINNNNNNNNNPNLIISNPSGSQLMNPSAHLNSNVSYVHNSSSKATMIMNVKPSPSTSQSGSTATAPSSHKRSKSHQINKIRGMITSNPSTFVNNNNVNLNILPANANNMMTDYSRLSSHHDFSEIHNSVFK